MREISGRIATGAARLTACVVLCATAAHGATITVNSVDDDVFPDSTGAVIGTPAKCTLRMAIAAANLDVAVGGGTGCVAGAGADMIVFDAALFTSGARTITLANVAMSEAPAVFSPTPNTTNALVISGALTITGPGATQLTLDGSATLANVAGMRLLVAGDGDDNTDRPVTISGVRFYRGRNIDRSAGCLYSTESLTLNDVTFENCESVGGASGSGFGGALGVGNVLAGTAVPSVSITNSKFLGNRAVRGTAPFDGVGTDNRRPDNGAASMGSGTRKVGAVTLTNVLFNGNSAERHGAMLIQNATSVLISGSHFIANVATGTDPFVTNNLLVSNGSGRFGGFRITDVSGDVTINNSTRVNGNVANEERGGFGVASVAGTVTMNMVDISGNYVNRGRIGGFEVLTDTFDVNGNCQGLQLRPVNISQIRVQGNSVATNTGGFRVLCSGALTMSNAWVIGNETRGYRLALTDTVSTGGGTGNSAGQLAQATDATAAQSTATLTNVLFRGNETNATVPPGSGGGGFGVFSVFGLGTFTADSIRVIDNFAENGNAGVTLNARGAGRNYLVVNSEFAGNDTPGTTALRIETDGNYTLRNSTVSGHASGTPVVLNANTNTTNGINVAIEHSTIARNSSQFVEGFNAVVSANQPNPGVVTNTLFNGNNAAITFKNSILGTRSPGFTGASPVLFAAGQGVTNVTATNTLLEWTGGAPGTFCSGAGMKCNIGSLVSPLAYNGGPDAIRTMALMAGSPAIDAGGAVLGGLTTDQRGAGFPRVVGAAVDMGAYESAPATTYGCTLDIDGNSARDPLTDGLLVIRALFGLTGTAATNGAIGTSPTRSNWAAIQSYLNANCGTNLAP